MNHAPHLLLAIDDDTLIANIIRAAGSPTPTWRQVHDFVGFKDAEATDRKPDLVILGSDWKRVFAHVLDADLPFIVLSDQDSSRSAVAALQAGAVDYLLLDELGRLPTILQRLDPRPTLPPDAREREALLRNQWHKTEMRLRQSERRYRQLAETSPVGIFRTDLEGRCLYVNPAWLRITGLKEDEVIGGPWDVGLASYEREAIVSAWTKAMQAGEAYERESQYQRPSGEIRWVLAQAVFETGEDQQPEGYIGTLHDIHEAKIAQTALVESLEKYRQLFSTMLAAYAYHEAIYNEQGELCDFRFLEVNPVFERDMGFRRDDIVGRTYSDVFPDSDPFGFESIARALENDEPLAYEREQPDGRLFAFQAYRSRANFFACAFTDITERRRIEEEAELRRRQLVQADKLASLGTLVAGVAHEINNPNNYILLNTGMLREIWNGVMPILEHHRQNHGDFFIGPLDFQTAQERVPMLLEAIDDGGRRIKSIVVSLKDFARGDATPNMNEDVDINEASRRACELSRLNKSTRDFRFEPGRDLPHVRGSMQRIEQVLINLLINAGEALTSPEQAIRLSTAFDAERGQVVINVSDEGGGIPHNILNRITDPFFTTKRDTGGTGLGLSISDSIIREHGGKLLFESNPGEGATVTVRLPALTSELELT